MSMLALVRSRFVRHSAWNLASVAAPAAVGLLAIPVLTRALGPARFGLLAIAWALLEYLAVFDLGLSRATLRHVAQRLRAGDDDLGATVSASLAAQAALGAAAGALIAALTPFVVDRALDVPPELAAEARGAFLMVAATMPFVLLGLALRALLEAAERFDLAAAVRAPASAATFLVPALAAALGATLTEILALLLAVRVVACAATALLVRRAIPGLAFTLPRRLGALRSLAGYGGWIGVTNILSPFFLYFDRFALAVIVGVTAVGLYAGPAELAFRMLLVPAAVVSAVFPAASTLFGEGRRAELRRLLTGSVGALAVLLLPVVVLGTWFARPIVEVWLGAGYADPGATVLRILLPGVLVTSLAHVPVAFLQAAGRAELAGRLHLAMALVHLIAAPLLVARYGAVGAAAAWTARVTVDALALFVIASRALALGRAPDDHARAPLGVAAGPLRPGSD